MTDRQGSPVAVGVIGVGRMGGLHARTYARMPGVELVGVVDVDSDRAAAVAKENGTEVVADIETLSRRVRAVSVAVPTAAHFEVARELLERGVHVLVEKPIAASLAQAQALVAAADKADRILMVGHTERFNPVIRSIGSLIRHPGFVEVHRLAPFNPRGTDVDVVLDLMIHDLDLLVHFVGGPGEVVPATQVDAVGVKVLTDAPDIANARIRFATGTVANLTASRVSLERMRKVRMFEPDLYVSLDTANRTAKAHRLIRDGGGVAPRIEAVDLGQPSDDDPVETELEAFVDAVHNGTTPPVAGAEALAAMELAERVRSAIASDEQSRTAS